MYISILDYQEAKVTIIKVPTGIDVEEYIDDVYGLSNVSYMTSEQLNLEVTYI